MPKKLIKKAAVAFLVLAFVLTPIRWCFFVSETAKALEIPEEEKWQDYANYIVIDEDTTWSGNVIYDNPDKPVVVVNGATLTIEKGTQIKILSLEVYLGRIVAEGTEKEKITFTKAIPNIPDDIKPECFKGQEGLIRFSETGWLYGYGVEPSIMRYVEFDNMGAFDYIDPEECACPRKDGNCQAMKPRIFPGIFNIARADELPNRIHPALRFEYGNLHIENSSFKNNHYADIEVSTDYYVSDERVSSLEVINSNFESNSEGTALISNATKYADDEDPIADKNLVRLKNNWYDSALGPRVAPDYIVGGAMLEGDYTLLNFRSKNLIADPVVIIPGILGSNSEYVGGIGQLKLDPIMHTFKNLMASFEENGYTADQNLFEFPYEWRNSNEITAGELKNKIQAIKNQTEISKVDLVAHSMGGLISRFYIEGENYQNDVDQLITLGTPHKGSPSSYMTWEAGEIGIKLEDYIIKKIFSIEADHADYDDLGKYIRERVVSVGELLPDYNYLQEAGTMRIYPGGYPRNEFLENLNQAVNVNKLEKINFTNIIGNITGETGTISGYRVVDSDIWDHGMPENYYNPENNQGIEYDAGDETVPLVSAEGIISDEEIEINSTHNDLPTKAQCYVIDELTGKTDCEYVDTFDRVVSLLTFGVFSPIDIQVEAPDGKKVGKNFITGGTINEIAGAYYTGAGSANEFLTIPNPIDGGYKIHTQGTGSGGYTIEAAKITENPVSGIVSESTAPPITGIAAPDQEETKEIEVRGTQILTENQDTVSPAISIINPQENKTYLNNQDLKINYTISDNVSQNIPARVFLDGNNFSQQNLDLSLQNLGEHQFKITATDEAGNQGEKEVSFKIETNVKAVIDNVNHYASLGLIKNKRDKTVLISRLEFIREMEKFKDMLEKSRFFNKRTKEKLVAALEGQINWHLDWLAKYVEQRSKAGAKNGIDIKVGSLLIESLNFLKYN